MTSNIDPSFITGAPVSKALMRQNLQYAKDEITALQALSDDFARHRTASVNPEAFGAVGDNVNDDTNALLAALATGSSVELTTGKKYRITSSLVLKGQGQQLFSRGGAYLFPVGNFHCVTLGTGTAASAQMCGVENIFFDCRDLTGGYAIYCSGSDRQIMRDLLIFHAPGGIYIESCNHTVCHNIWQYNTNLHAGFVAYGNNARRSDGLRIVDCVVSGKGNDAGDANADGLIHDGNFHTINIHNLALIGMRRGIVVRNTSGGTNPLGIFAHDLEVDFPYREAIRLEAGNDFHFVNPYLHGSAADSGVYVGPDVGTVQIANGRITSHFAHGLLLFGQEINIANTYCTFNSRQGNFRHANVLIKSTAQRVTFNGGTYGLRRGIGAIHLDNFYIEPGAVAIVVNGASIAGGLNGVRNDTTGNNNVQIVGNSGAPFSQLNEWLIGTSGGMFGRLGVTITGGVVTALDIVDQGTGYILPPTISIIGATGSGATATCTVAAGKLTSVTITSGGSGYTDGATAAEVRSVPITPQLRPRSTGNLAATLSGAGSGNVVLRNDLGIAASFENMNGDASHIRLGGFANGSVGGYPIGTANDIDHAVLTKGEGRVIFGGPTQNGAGALLYYKQIRMPDGSLCCFPIHALS